jgi:hypothetical protein
MCAYHWEQNPNNENLNDLVINGFEAGIGDSPEVGLQLLSGANIKNFPKVAYANVARANSLVTTAGIMTYIIQDPVYLNNFYAVDYSGNVYQSIGNNTNGYGGKTWVVISGNSTTNAHGNGLIIWSIPGTGGPINYLFVSRDNFLDCIEVNVSGHTGSWTTLLSNDGSHYCFSLTYKPYGVNHNCLASVYSFLNGAPTLYFCNGQYLASLSAGLSGFNPSSSATSSYIWNETALVLPSSEGGIATSLAEMKNNIYTTIGNLIVPWDYTSSGYQFPFAFTEFVNKMIVIDNILYCFGGSYVDELGNAWWEGSANVLTPIIAGRGYIYYYDGWGGGVLKKIPDHLAPALTGFLEPTFYIGGYMKHLNKLFFGVSSSFSIQSAGLGVMSVDMNNQAYGIESQPGGALSIENGYFNFYTALCSLNNVLVNGNTLSYVGNYYENSPTYYCFDYTDQLGNRENFEIRTDIIKVGTNQNPKTFSQCEIRLRSPLYTGETIYLSAYNYFASYAQEPTNPVYTAPANDTTVSIVVPIFLQASEYIQIRISASLVANGSGCPIQEIILR